MPKINYTASKFNNYYNLNGTYCDNISWNEIVWAAMTMGKPNISYLLRHSWHSINDLLVRLHTVYANLKETKDGYYSKSDLYIMLDPTEKCGVSYFMGMLAAKTLSARILDTPWMFHLSILRQLGNKASLINRSEPDLVGLDPNFNWIVAEAKGRTGSYDSLAMSKAKQQTRQLRNINGELPILRVAIQASFNPDLTWHIEDPEEYEETAKDLEVDLEKAMTMYYSTFLESLGQRVERINIEEETFVIYELNNIGITICLHSDIYKMVIRGEFNIEVMQRIAKKSKKFRSEKFTFFQDGFAISLDSKWSSEIMELDPLMR